MLRMLGSPRRCCDRLTRRETLRAGALSLFSGLSLPALLRAEEKRRHSGPAKSVMLLYLLGGAATQDMFDLKPEGPTDTRGEFKPIHTNVPGIDICEHLPRMANWMHKAAIVRSVNHKAGCHNCLPSYTGCEGPQPDQHPRETHPPSMGSVCEFLNKQRGRDFPDYVYLPTWLGWGQAFRRGGPYAGFLGKRYDPLITECNPFYNTKLPAPRGQGYPVEVLGQPVLPDSVLPAEMTLDRLNTRRDLLVQFDDQRRLVESAGAVAGYDRTQQRAFSILTSAKMRAAFDVETEDARLRDRYGRNLFGHSTLIGRRLVEAGVRFVNVTWDLYWGRVNIDYDAWDTHVRNFPILKDNKLPGLDQTYTALMEDLEGRGLLDETLVVVMSEMGRTPRINANGGRDHWTYCYSALFAGAGIKGGTICGASDAQAAYVKDRPVSTADICATIYHCLGIDPELLVPDRGGRPLPVANGGQVIQEIVG